VRNTGSHLNAESHLIATCMMKLETKRLPWLPTICWTLMLFLSAGFRVYPGGNRWTNSISDPKIWIRFCEDYIPTKNDLNDSLEGTTLTHAALVSSILADYNSLPPSFLVLADATTDPAYSSTLHSERVITICKGSTQALIAGFAQPKYSVDGSRQIGCEIQFTTKILESAKDYVATITHEIGHCLGLDHSHDTRYAVMSYFADTKKYFRLQTDDKMGIATQFARDPNLSREEATLGLSCQAR
jgi:hypothetical protein